MPEEHHLYVHTFKCKWAFFCRTTPQMKNALKPLDLMVTEKFIPTLLSRQVDDQECTLLAFPCCFDGLGLVVPSSLAARYQSSQAISKPLITRILNQCEQIGDATSAIRSHKREVRLKNTNTMRD